MLSYFMIENLINIISEDNKTYFIPKYGQVYRLINEDSEFLGVYFGIIKEMKTPGFTPREVSSHLFLAEKENEVIKYTSDFYKYPKCLVMFCSKSEGEPYYSIVPVIDDGKIERKVEAEFAKERINANLEKYFTMNNS